MSPAMSPQLAAEMGRLARQLTEMQARITQLERGAATAQLDNASIENGALTINDDSGDPQIVIGLQPDGTYAHAATGSGGPPPPSDPTVVPLVQSLMITWDGMMAGEQPPLADFAGVQVHVSADPDFTPDATTLQSTFIAPGVRPAVGLQQGVMYYVALVTINAAGVLSEPSNVISGLPMKVADAIDPGSITSDKVGFSITGGGTHVTIATVAPSSPATGDLWFDGTNGYVMKQWDGTQWVASQFGSGSISAQSITSDLIAANSITAGLVAAGAIDGMTVNALTIAGTTITGSNLEVSGAYGGMFVYSTGGQITVTYTASGSWTAPATVTATKAEGTAPGGGGMGGYNGGTNKAGVGGNGGEYAAEPAAAVTPGHAYSFTIPAPGTGGTVLSKDGGDAGNLVMALDAVTLTAHGGGGGKQAGGGTNGPQGTGSTNTVHHPGGLGWINPSLANQNGGGGAGSGGPTQNGRNGNGNYGASAVPGGGPGGDGFGAGPDFHTGKTGGTPGGGGGGGANATGGTNGGGDGNPGQLKLTFTAASPVLLASFCGAPTTDPVTGTAVPGGLYILGAQAISFQGTPGEFAHGTINSPGARQLGFTTPQSLNTDVPAALLMTGAAAGSAPLTTLNGLPVQPLSTFYPSGGVFQTRANTTTVTNDTYLQTGPMVPNGIYHVDCFLIYSGGSSGATNFKFTLGSPVGCEIDWYVPVYQNTLNANVYNETSYVAGIKTAYTTGVASTSAIGIQIIGTAYNGANAGVMGVMWAQGTSSGTTTRMWSGSRLTLWQIG